MRCSLNSEYLSRTRTARELEHLEREAFNDIQSSFRCAVEYGVRTEDLADTRYRVSSRDINLLFLRNPDPRTGGGRFIEGSTRTYVLNQTEWITNQRLTKTPANLGTYIYDLAVILLHCTGENSESWCRHVLIHETLHSASLYSRIWSSFPSIVSRHYLLIEGLTQCLTGYVILKKHPKCYGMWKQDNEGSCGIAYRGSTRLFCSLAQIVGINPIANLYFSNERSFGSPWRRFVESISPACSADFEYTLDETVAFRESLFIEACAKSVKGFKRIYDSRAKSLDFSQIR